MRLEPELRGFHPEIYDGDTFDGCTFAVVLRAQSVRGGLSQFQMLHQADVLGWGIHVRQHYLEFDS